MKMILAALALSSGVASAALLDSADFTCRGLQKEVTRNGFQVINGEVIYASEHDCSSYAQQAWITTGDGWNCAVGFRCLSSDPNASLTSN